MAPSQSSSFKEVDKPVVGPTDVLVEVYASSVNPKDWKLNTKLSSLTPKFGPLQDFHIIGDDLAGVVVEKGRDVSGFEIGDSVYGMNMRLRTAACAEFARISQKRIAHKPKNMSYNEAAAVPLAALTALQAFYLGKVKQGSKVLVIGASGGVGTYAIQIAKAMGANVTGVCSGKNAELVTSLGADKIIDYTQGNYLSENNDLDMVFDATAYESLASCSSLMKADGIFISTAGHGKALFDLYKPKFTKGGQTAQPIWVESYTRDLETLKQYIEDGLVKSVLDSEHALADIEDAYAQSKTGRSRGKVVINIRD